MARAISLARQGWGSTHPNPLVGAVIIENGEIVAEGFHPAAGQPHAERQALKNLGRRPAPHSTMAVTLEPCSTHGRTPPCVDGIIEAGISRVLIGAEDPNPLHQGRGVTLLRQAGIEVETGVLEADCQDLNLIFNHRMSTGRPLVAAKLALTLDGKTATRTGRSKWITGALARQNVMLWRQYFPAIGVGAGTAQADDPALTARLPAPQPKVLCGRRFVFDRRLLLADKPLQYQVFNDHWSSQTVLVCDQTSPSQTVDQLHHAGITVWQLEGENPSQRWAHFLELLLKAELNGIYIEGGAGLLSGLFGIQAIDYLFVYRGSQILFDMEALSPADTGPLLDLSKAARLSEIRRESFGADDLVRGHLIPGQAE